MRTMWIFDRRPSSFLKVISLQALYMPLRQLRRAITIYKVASWHEKRLFSKLSNIFIRLSNAFVGPFHLVYWLLSADNTHRWITMIVLCWMVERWSSKMSQNIFIEFCSIDLLSSIKTFYACFFMKIEGGIFDGFTDFEVLSQTQTFLCIFHLMSSVPE